MRTNVNRIIPSQISWALKKWYYHSTAIYYLHSNIMCTVRMDLRMVALSNLSQSESVYVPSRDASLDGQRRSPLCAS